MRGAIVPHALEAMCPCKLWQKPGHEHGGALAFRGPAAVAAGAGAPGHAAPAAGRRAEGEAAPAGQAAADLRRRRQPVPNHVATWPVADLHVHRMNHHGLVDVRRQLLALQERHGLLAAVLGGLRDCSRHWVPGHLLVGDVHTENFRVDGGLQGVVHHQGAFLIQQARVGGAQKARVEPGRVAWDVDVEVQGFTAVKLHAAGFEHGLLKLLVRDRPLLHLDLVLVGQDVRDLGHHLGVRLLGLGAEVGVQDSAGPRQQDHPGAVPDPGPEVPAHLEAHQTRAVEDHGLGAPQRGAAGLHLRDALGEAHAGAGADQRTALPRGNDQRLEGDDLPGVGALVHQGDLLLVAVDGLRGAQEVLDLAGLHLPLRRIPGGPLLVLLRAVQTDGRREAQLAEGEAMDVGHRGRLALLQDPLNRMEGTRPRAHHRHVEALCHEKHRKAEPIPAGSWQWLDPTGLASKPLIGSLGLVAWI